MVPIPMPEVQVTQSAQAVINIIVEWGGVQYNN